MNATETTTYDIRCYQTGKQIGTVEMTATQHARYTRESDRDTGVITLADLIDIVNSDAVTLECEDQDTSLTVFCE